MAVWGMGVMVGPIIGPTLGGWLTESYSWRWVFFINLPIGMLALAGVAAFLPAKEPKHGVTFDVFGFATLALAIGALQAMLDRGEQLDWFGSKEIVTEALLAAISFAFFVVHTATAGKVSFFKRELLRDPNFAVGTFFIFVVGAVLYATRALIPPMLQNLMGYPVATAGLVTAPSGAGTMVAMLLAGKLLRRVDARLILLAGMGISALALWQMMHYTIVLSASDIVWPGVIQGFGLGLVFVPLSTLTFSTLTAELRADGTATYSLMRNIGSSIGISIVQTLMTRYTQVSHADLAAHVTVFDSTVRTLLASGSKLGIALLDQGITQQAAMIAYVDDFKLMFIATLLAIPLLVLIRSPHSASTDEAASHAALD
jgi:DHA2 family multidrug resistance protein